VSESRSSPRSSIRATVRSWNSRLAMLHAEPLIFEPDLGLRLILVEVGDDELTCICGGLRLSTPPWRSPLSCLMQGKLTPPQLPYSVVRNHVTSSVLGTPTSYPPQTSLALLLHIARRVAQILVDPMYLMYSTHRERRSIRSAQ